MIPPMELVEYPRGMGQQENPFYIYRKMNGAAYPKASHHLSGYF